MPFIAPAIASVSSAFAAGGILAAGTVGGFLAKLGGSILLSAASKALAKKPKAAQFAGSTVTAREPVAGREIVYGFRGRKSGTIIYMENRPGSVAGDINDRVLDLVIVLTGHPVQSLGAIYFDGQLAMDAAGVPQAPFAGAFDVEKHLGVGAAFPLLRSKSRGKWTIDHRLEGCAGIAISMSAGVNSFPNGLPNITVDVMGKNDILDPRTGLRGWSQNPALCIADYMSMTRYGLNAQIGSATGINTAELIASANVCDETVPAVGGGSESRYTCNGVLSLDEPPSTNIPSLLTSMAGDVVWSGGQWYIFAGYYRAPVVTLTASDVREQGLSLATRQSMAENFNAVRGTFISPENDWQADDFPAYQSAVYRAEDGGELVFRDIALPFTTSASMAQRLAKIELEKQRRQQTVEFAGKLTAWKVGVGDVVNLTYDRWGMAAKPYDVTNLTLSIEQQGDGAAILPTLTLRETSPLIYDWNVSEAQIYAAAPRTDLPSALNILPPGTPTAVESLYETNDSSGAKVRVDLTWSASQSEFVAQYQIETRLGPTGSWAVQGRTSATGFALLDWPPGNWSFRVAAISQIGVSSPYAQTTREILGLGAPPAALSNVILQSVGGLAVIEWDLSPDLDVRLGGTIEWRHSAAAVPTWANSVSMKTVPGGTALAVMPLKPGAYLGRAKDASGGLGPVSTISTTAIQVIPFGNITTLQEDTTFTGARSGTVIDTGTLRLDSAGNFDSVANVDAIANVDALGGILTTGTYTFAAGFNFGAVVRRRLRSVIDLSVIGVLDNVDTRPGNVDTWINFDGIGGGEVDCVVEIRTTQTNPGGSPVWSGWSRVDNTEISAWGVQARAVLTSADAGFTPAVSQLRLIAEEAL